MAFTEYAKVKNVLTANTKWGKRRVCNVYTDNGEEAIWAEDLSAFSHIKPGTTIEVIRGVKGKLTILERSAPTPQDPPRNVNGKGLKPINEVLSRNTTQAQTYFQSASNRSNTPVNHHEVLEDLIHDVPMLSDLDKKKVAAFIDQQAKLYRYTVDTVAKQFPELVGVGDRGIRSIALSLLINTNHMINRNLQQLFLYLTLRKITTLKKQFVQLIVLSL